MGIAPPLLAAACAIMAVGATLQGSVGFGLALASAPLLALVDLRLVPGPVLVCAAFLTAMMMLRERAETDWRGVRWALLGRVPGTLVGAGLLATLSVRVMGVVFGVIVLLAVGISIWGVRVLVTRTSLFFAGVVSGIMGTTSSIGGPPFALLYSHDAGPKMRGTMSAYFTFGATLSVVVLAVIGRFGVQEILWASAMLPGVMLGFLISNRTRRWLDRGYTRSAVLCVAGTGGVVAIGKQLL